MKHAYATLLIASLSTSTAFGQAYSELDINELRARFYSNGFIGSGPAATQGAIRVPSASNAPLLYSGGLWMGGLSSGGQLHFAGHLYGTPGELDYFPGPLTTDGTASITAPVSAQYDQVWQVTRAQVEVHRAYFECLATPGCDVNALFPGGYTTPQSFISWPAMGDASLNQAAYLAPFVDYDADGLYDPSVGDHPCILGDQALFAISNDRLSSHTLTGGLPIGVEIHTMPFAYTGAPALANTVFVNYKIINRGTLSIPGFRLGHFADFELGCPDDDIIGTDVGRSLLYAANGDDNDQSCSGLPGFGQQPPAFGMAVLKGPMLDPDGIDNAQTLAELYVNGTGYADGTFDNERFGLSNSMYFLRSGPTAMTDPGTGITSQFYNYARGIWKDSSPLRNGGTGYGGSPTAVITDFAFPGDTDPMGYGTAGVPQAPWSATLSPSDPDPRGVGGLGAFTLEPGRHVNVLVAFVHARADSGGAVASVGALQARVDSVRAFAQTIPGMWTGPETEWPSCANGQTGIDDMRGTESAILLYPNPATGSVLLALPAGMRNARITLLDGAGRKVLSTMTGVRNTPLSISGLAPGLYVVRVESEGRFGSARLVVE